ncbi:hypothetical protein ABIC71_002369 [Herbaspirillum seropedicae]
MFQQRNIKTALDIRAWQLDRPDPATKSGKASETIYNGRLLQQRIYPAAQ